ncbi:MAG: tyrosine-type recombinase/integrase [Bacteroidales bacterium]|nr:tyrosine-type recombinase/integrase [Bacteroidales bacterium]
MKSIIVEKVIHKGEERIALRFPYDTELGTIIRGFVGARWSKTLNCWHIPDNQSTMEKLALVFKDRLSLESSAISEPLSEDEKGKKSADLSDFPREVEIPLNPTKHHVHFVDKSEGKVLHKPDLPDGKKAEVIGFRKEYGPVEFTINEGDGRLIVRFTGRYDQEWIKELKSYGRVWYDSDSKEWLMSWTRMKVDSLSDYFASNGVEVIVKRAVLSMPVREQRHEKSTQIRERNLSIGIQNGIEIVRRHLNEKRYSSNTVETYISLLDLFFKYFSDKASGDIIEDDISDFFHDFIVSNKYSASYHNQLISAIKMYYKLNGSTGIRTGSLGRPRRGRSLPKVFSKEEVKLILNSSRNLKHRLILWMIYSCGLRRSEVINIRITDLDRSRGILNVREAKGMKDRIVPVSDKVWEKVDEYKNSYHPVFWFFEGQTGGQYSSESVYRVFKQALKNAGIRKEVGVHSLRHSYATHLHEDGVDIRYIQELLGHKSSRTTEIYTHVSRRNLIAVRSPIDDMDLK